MFSVQEVKQSNMISLEIEDYERTVQTLNAQLAERDEELKEKTEDVKRVEDKANSLQKQLGRQRMFGAQKVNFCLTDASHRLGPFSTCTSSCVNSEGAKGPRALSFFLPHLKELFKILHSFCQLQPHMEVAMIWCENCWSYLRSQFSIFFCWIRSIFSAQNVRLKMLFSNFLSPLHCFLFPRAETAESQYLQAEDRGNKLKQLLVKAKKDLADSKKIVSFLFGRESFAKLLSEVHPSLSDAFL